MDIEHISALIFGFFVAILLLDFNTLEKTVSKQEDNFIQNYDQVVKCLRFLNNYPKNLFK